MSFLEVKSLTKRLDNGPIAVEEISFQQEEGEHCAILGETGSGKSSLLKLLAGLLQPDSGEVWLMGQRVPGAAEKLIPGHPAIAYLSQHFELRNNYRVYEILEYANQLSEKEANRIYELCQIDQLLPRWSDELSGGERQRIALARLLTGRPRLLLLDEPFSNLDWAHKQQIKSVLKNIGEELGISAILVSHDPADVLPWADKMMLIKKGRIIQQGSPEELYHRPIDEYAAALLGEYNLLPPSFIANLVNLPDTGKKVFLRPEYWMLADTEETAMPAKLVKAGFRGSHCMLELESAGTIFRVLAPPGEYRKGQQLMLRLRPAEFWQL